MLRQLCICDMHLGYPNYGIYGMVNRVIHVGWVFRTFIGGTGDGKFRDEYRAGDIIKQE